MPVGLMLARTATDTAIVRTSWRTADVPLCRLCPTCTAYPVGQAPEDQSHSVCLLVVGEQVKPANAVLFKFPKVQERRR